jgi:hypothetical protein
MYNPSTSDFEYSDMTGIDIETLVTNRLEDLADQIEYLFSIGKYEEAELLRHEGLELAEHYDDEGMFLYVDQSVFQ